MAIDPKWGVEIPSRGSKKTAISVRIDTDVIDWLREIQPNGYQTLINNILRQFMNLNKDNS